MAGEAGRRVFPHTGGLGSAATGPKRVEGGLTGVQREHTGRGDKKGQPWAKENLHRQEAKRLLGTRTLSS